MEPQLLGLPSYFGESDSFWLVLFVAVFPGGGGRALCLYV